MLKTRLSAFLSLLIVFISGAVAGGFVYRFYNPPPQHRPSPEEVRKIIINDMKKAVHLDDQQVSELEKIMDDIRAQGQDLRNRMDVEGKKIRDQQTEEIKKILRDDQQPLYDKWRHDRQLEREKRMKEQQPGGLYKEKDKDSRK
jgi:uncharacterized membrane protein